MASPALRFVLLAVCAIIGITNAGPLGSLPNVTSSDLGLKEESCALGDVVYMAGDEFPGSTPCERCTCSEGGVQCAKQRCEPRPGCKALHRSDLCCPIYQCECEQEGRTYGNGEKLVDPADPCRVCYCQGGEVVCRRIVCFLRDDCRPRLVPGRCCPEYDNCPLTGVTSAPGVATSVPNGIPIEDVGITSSSSTPKGILKQEITIKEITPVSEIPVITDVKIKEILPSPSIEVSEYTSSKSPLIPREVTNEDFNGKEGFHNLTGVDATPSAATDLVSSSPETYTKASFSYTGDKAVSESMPSKTNLASQDATNSKIYASNIPSITPEIIHVASTKAFVIEDDDPISEHNPAFPPLPDDLSVSSNHEDEIVSEQNTDIMHLSADQEGAVSDVITTESTIPKEPKATTLMSPEKEVTDTKYTTFKYSDSSTDSNVRTAHSTNSPLLEENSMSNLRSAITTEIINVPSFIPEEIKREPDNAVTGATKVTYFDIASSTNNPNDFDDKKYSENIDKLETVVVSDINTSTEIPSDLTISTSTTKVQEQTTSSIAKSNIATEIASQVELSSLPIETSDQNPHETVENSKDQSTLSTIEPTATDVTDIEKSTKYDETTKKSVTKLTEVISSETFETTESFSTAYGSPEISTDSVELIKISPVTGEKAAIIEAPNRGKNNVLTDLINLVSDVASISDHTEQAAPVNSVTTSTGISESEELIPVNAGYKSKNHNWNLNSITEVPLKTKNQTPTNKQKVVEIEDDEFHITDSPAPNDKVEPTTRRPIIDNVSDNMPENKIEKKDIEIITRSYVPTINRRPTKVVMKKNNEKSVLEETSKNITSASTETPDLVVISTSEIAATEYFEASSTDSPSSVATSDDISTIEPQ